MSCLCSWLKTRLGSLRSSPWCKSSWQRTICTFRFRWICFNSWHSCSYWNFFFFFFLIAPAEKSDAILLSTVLPGLFFLAYAWWISQTPIKMPFKEIHCFCYKKTQQITPKLNCFISEESKWWRIDKQTQNGFKKQDKNPNYFSFFLYIWAFLG